MIPKKFLGILGLFGMLTFMTTGCGGDPGVKVTGSVTKGGKALQSVKIAFISQEKEKGSAKGTVTDAEGKFELMVKPGKYTVTLSKLVDKKGNVPTASDDAKEDAGQLEAAGKLLQAIPEAYVSSATSPINVEVPAEGKQFPPFEVK